MNTVKLKDLFKGLTVGRPQIAGSITIFPLLLTEDRPQYPFSTVVGVNMTTGGRFGNMGFRNPKNMDVLVHNGASFLDKKQGQDHAAPSVTVVTKGSSKNVSVAMCIQSTQGGSLTAKSDDSNWRALPYQLRTSAWHKREDREYGKLWGDIKEFNSRLKAGDRAHLEDYFNTYDDKLSKFVAHFEPVPNQIGAIVLNHNEVVGVELTPNTQYWEDIFHIVIRDVYGSLVAHAKDSENTVNLRIRRSSRPLTLEDIQKGFDKFLDKLDQEARTVVRGFVNKSFAYTVDSNFKDSKNKELYEVCTLTSESTKEVSGQFVLNVSDDLPAYVSLNIKDAWSKPSTRTRVVKTQKDFDI